MTSFQVTALLLMLLFVWTYCQNDVRKPPNIIIPRNRTDLYYSLNTAVVVICTADGQPQPSYRWMQNGRDLIPSSYITFDSTTGALKIPSFSTRYEATYMCIARNVFDNGTGGQITASSWSARIRLWQSRIDRFDNPDEITQQVAEYQYVVLLCGERKAVVGAKIAYTWYDSKLRGIDMDGGRLFIDQQGNLHFTYALRQDGLVSSYRCQVSVNWESIIGLGTKNVLTVTQSSSQTPVAIKPQIEYSNTGVKGLRFTSVKLECVFSGFDPAQPSVPVTQWLDDSGKAITTNEKYTVSSDGRVLTVKNLQEEDERQYFCWARNSAGQASHAVFMNVTSGPIFINGAPTYQTMPENSDVQFNCDARSASGETPPAPPVWYINGAKMGPQNDTNKYQLSEGNKILTIKKVKKYTDIMCVQCEVTNSEDTVLANACLNVLLPITIVIQPQPLVEINYGDIVDMTVTATTDPSMTLSYRWEFHNKSYVGSESPPNMIYNLTTMAASFNTSNLTSEQYGAIGGLYRRVIYHLYETKVVEIDIVLNDRPTPNATAASTSASTGSSVATNKPVEATTNGSGTITGLIQVTAAIIFFHLSNMILFR